MKGLFSTFVRSTISTREAPWTQFLRYPMVLLVIALLVGFLFQEIFPLPLTLVLILVVLGMLLLGCGLKVSFLFPAGFFLQWFASGALLFFLVFQLPMDSIIALQGERVTFEGHIAFQGERPILQGIRGFSLYSPSLLLRTVRGGPRLPDSGLVRIHGRLRLITSCSNPGVTDYFNFWWKRRVMGDFTVEDLRVIDKAPWWQTVEERFRERREQYFDSWQGELGSMYSLFTALLWGERGDDFYREADWLRRTGVYHAFCVSGMHMGLFGVLVLFLLRLCFPASRYGYILAVVFAFGYLLFCGMVPSAFRAWLMLSFYLMGKFMGRNTLGITFLVTAFLIMFVLQPEIIYHPGAQLSFTSTAGIVLFADFLAKVTQQGGILHGYLKANAGLTAAVLFTSMPFLIGNGFSFSSHTFTGNILILPLVQATVLCIFLTVPFGFIPGSIPLLAKASEALLRGITSVSTFLVERIPFLYFDFSIQTHRYYGLLVWMVIIAALLIWRAGKNRKIILFVALSVTFLFLVVIVSSLVTPDVEFWVLDVGQGLATVARCGDRAVVFDTGGIIRTYGNIGQSVVSPFLRYQGVSEVEAIFITHPHLDHQAGTVPLTEAFPVNGVWYRANGAPMEGDRVVGIDSLSRFTFCESLRVEVIPVYGPTVNDQALVFRLHLPGVSVLISGDIEEGGMRHLFRFGSSMFSADILIMPHHGQYTETLSELVSTSGARSAIISVGENRYGHPDPRTLRFLEETGVEGYVTYRDGGIRVIPSKDGWRIEEFGKRKPVALDSLYPLTGR